MTRCEMCGTEVDESDYQDDGYRHTTERCAEYLKAALGAANRHAEGMAKLATHLQAELDQLRRSVGEVEATSAELERRTEALRDALHQSYRYIRDGAAASALSLIDATVGAPP